MDDTLALAALDAVDTRISRTVQPKLQPRDLILRQTKRIRLNASPTALEIRHRIQALVRADSSIVIIVGLIRIGFGVDTSRREVMGERGCASPNSAFGEPEIAFVLSASDLGGGTFLGAGAVRTVLDGGPKGGLNIGFSTKGHFQRV